MEVEVAAFVPEGTGMDLPVYRPKTPLRIKTVSDSATENQKANLDDNQVKPAGAVSVPAPLLPPTGAM
jgi:hypothetical protein